MTKDYNLIALSPHPLVVDETPVMYRAGQIRSLFSAIADRDAQIERMRSELDEIATPAPPPEPAKAEVVQMGMAPDAAWIDLIEKDDRTSPAEYPDHALITRDELASYMRLATPPNAPAAARSAAGAGDIAELEAHVRNQRARLDRVMVLSDEMVRVARGGGTPLPGKEA